MTASFVSRLQHTSGVVNAMSDSEKLDKVVAFISELKQDLRCIFTSSECQYTADILGDVLNVIEKIRTEEKND